MILLKLRLNQIVIVTYNEPEVDFEYSICVATNDTTTTSNNCPLDANDIYETYRLIQGKCFYFEWKEF